MYPKRIAKDEGIDETLSDDEEEISFLRRDDDDSGYTSDECHIPDTCVISNINESVVLSDEHYDFSKGGNATEL